MKLRLTAAVALLATVGACTALGGAPSDPLTLTVQGCDATRAAVEATDAAVLAGKISKRDAQTAFIALTAATSACNAAVAALKAAPAASGAK